MGSAEAEIIQDRVRHAGGFDLEVNPFNLALRINDEGVTHHSHVFPPHEFLQSVAVVAACNWAGFGISQEREGQRVFVDEFCVGCAVVLADAQHMNARFAEPIPAIPEIAGFLGAARGVVFRVEVQNNSFSPEVRELNGLSALIRECEIRCRIADLQSHGIE